MSKRIEIMKAALQWAIQEKRVDYIPTEGDLEHFAKQVQADALRHAANMIKLHDLSGSQTVAIHLLEEAGKLEAQKAR